MEKDRKIYRFILLFFILAAIVHGIGYATNYLYLIGWLMWLPAMIITVIAVLRIYKDKYIINRYLKKNKILFSTEFIVVVIVFLYVIFNVVFCCYILRNGGGEYKDGIYYLINLGERIKEITAEEYGVLLLAEYRMFTGHILILYALLLLFFRIKIMEEEPL